MQADETAAGGHLLGELVEVRERRMAAAAVGIDHDRVGLGDALVGRPFAVEGDVDVDEAGGGLPQAGGEELDARVVLVLARAMARLAGDHEDVLLVRGREERGREQEESEEGLLHGLT